MKSIFVGFALIASCFLATPVCTNSIQGSEIEGNNSDKAIGFLLTALLSILRDLLVVASSEPPRTQQLRQSVPDILNVQIIGKGSNLCLDVTDVSSSDDANIEIYSCTGSSNQKWDIKYTGDIVGVESELFQLFTIVSKSSGKCLCTYRGSRENNASVVQYTCGNPLARNQYWYRRWARDDPSAVELVNVDSGKCLTVYNGGMTSGVGAVIYDCSGRPNEVWKYRK